MHIRLNNTLEYLRSSFWCVPALLVAAAIGLSFGMIAVDRLVKDEVLSQIGWVWSGGPEGARGLLSTIAGTMMTVAGVVFSITIVVLALVSSQLGPRLLRNFSQENATKFVLGTFIATFVYCLLILRTVRAGDGEFVPYVSISVALVLALLSVGMLIYFIHHVSILIQAPNIIALAYEDLKAAIERIYPRRLGETHPQPDHEPELPAMFDERAVVVHSDTSGYLRTIDTVKLMQMATEQDLLLQLHVRPGDFVVPGGRLLQVWPPERADDRLTKDLAGQFTFGVQRTPVQDIEFAVAQMVEAAVRALSPGINDPFTAITCVDRLGAALCQLAEREIPSIYRYDETTTLRVITDTTTFPGVVNAAYDQIRQYGRTSVAVTIRLLEMIAVVASRVQCDTDRAALRRQALMIKRGSETALPEEEDRKDVKERFQAVLNALAESADKASVSVQQTNSHAQA
jgi:uncharacterized membrane protein